MEGFRLERADSGAGTSGGFLRTGKLTVKCRQITGRLLAEELSASEGGLYIVELVAVSCVCHFDVQPRKSGLKCLFYR